MYDVGGDCADAKRLLAKSEWRIVNGEERMAKRESEKYGDAAAHRG